MADQGLNGGPVEVGPGPGEDPPRKRLRHEDHEVLDSSLPVWWLWRNYSTHTPQGTVVGLIGTGS